ncbi:MAG: polyprenyl synthetase family protein [Clostridia bacterium]|nr:polyprenyl synthetase family protein [Clostridia bacterium]
MKAGVLEAIAPELQMVEEKIAKYCRVRSGYLGEFAHLTVNSIDRYLRPACVLLSARLFNQGGEKVVALASIIQLIFLAAKIHRDVPEKTSDNQAEPLDPRDGTQLPVLVGDYLYGRFFTTLCEGGILDFLKPLADIICKINEGSILRLKAEAAGDFSEKTMLSIIEQETASLLSGACRLSSILGQASAADQEALSAFGHNLGMAYGILQENGDRDLAGHFGALALAGLDRLKECASLQELRQVLDSLVGKQKPLARIMVG